MKRLIVITALLAVLFSAGGCALLGMGTTVTATGVANRSYIGMPFDEFKQLSGDYSSLEEMTAEYSVYRINIWAGPPDNRYVSSAKFFVFDSQGRLVRIDSRSYYHGHPGGHHGEHRGGFGSIVP